MAKKQKPIGEVQNAIFELLKELKFQVSDQAYEAAMHYMYTYGPHKDATEVAKVP